MGPSRSSPDPVNSLVLPQAVQLTSKNLQRLHLPGKPVWTHRERRSSQRHRQMWKSSTTTETERGSRASCASSTVGLHYRAHRFEDSTTRQLHPSPAQDRRSACPQTLRVFTIDGISILVWYDDGAFAHYMHPEAKSWSDIMRALGANKVLRYGGHVRVVACRNRLEVSQQLMEESPHAGLHAKLHCLCKSLRLSSTRPKDGVKFSPFETIKLSRQ